MAPIVVLPPAIPFTVQLTPAFDVPLTVAVNCWVCETTTEALVGDSVTETPFIMVTEVEADFVESAALIALTVTVAGEGAVAGLVYRPPLEMVPTVELPPAIPFTVQLTPVFDVPLTVTVNNWV